MLEEEPHHVEGEGGRAEGRWMDTCCSALGSMILSAALIISSKRVICTIFRPKSWPTIPRDRFPIDTK